MEGGGEAGKPSGAKLATLTTQAEISAKQRLIISCTKKGGRPLFPAVAVAYLKL